MVECRTEIGNHVYVINRLFLSVGFFHDNLALDLIKNLDARGFLHQFHCHRRNIINVSYVMNTSSVFNWL